MARILTPRGRRPTGARRKTLWIDFVSAITGETALAAGASVLLASLNAAALALLPFTIVRTRASLLVTTDQVATSEAQLLGWGMAVVSEQASAIGVTAVPTPWTDAGSSLFFAYQLALNRMTFSSATGYRRLSKVWEVDSKAMRKVAVGEQVIITLENGNAATGLNFVTVGRILIKTN